MLSLAARGRTSGRARLALAVALCTALAASALALGARSAQAARGRWSPPQTWSDIAVHMALLPGDGSPYLGRILWWNIEHPSTFYVRQWGWRADGDNVDCASYPAAKFEDLATAQPDANIFCGGFAPLADSRLLIAGGTEPGTEYGIRVARIFAPGTGSSAGAWSSPVPDSMYGARWYPTVITLADGRLAAFSGSLYPHIEYFGGRTSGAALPTDIKLYRFGIDEYPVWDSCPPLQPDDGHRPTPRYGHTATRLGAWGMAAYFGGRDKDNKLSKELRFEYRNPQTFAGDYEYRWVAVPVTSPQSFHERAFHVAVPCDKDSTLVIWGGLQKNISGEAASDELWRLRSEPFGAGRAWKWEQLSPSGSPAPGATPRIPVRRRSTT